MTGALHLSGRAEIAGTPVFGPLQLDVGAGRWCCLLGPSGVGKSTLLRLLAGLAGPVRFHGRIVAPRPLALMAQDDLLLPWLDLPGNVALGARLRGAPVPRDRARALLARVGLARQADRRPGELSGGQRQRVALARTLMEDCPAVLLDEPFSALDARARVRMQDLAAELLAGRTVLHVTHDTAEAARLGQDVVVMTETGLEAIAAPAGAPPRAPRRPRPHDAPGTLDFQARLQRRLMETA